MTLPHDPHLPSTPHLAQVVVPPLIREELAKAMKTAGGRGGTGERGCTVGGGTA